MRNLLYAIIAFLIIGCSQGKNTADLDMAHVFPDSAAHFLDNIDSASIRSDETDAKFNELLADAKYRESRNTFSLMKKVIDFIAREDSLSPISVSLLSEWMDYAGYNILLLYQQREILYSKARYEKERKRELTIYGSVGIALLAAISLLVILNYRQKLRIREMQLGEKVSESASLMEEIEETRSRLSHEIEGLTSAINEKDSTITSREETVRQLFREQFSVIDDILSEYYIKRDAPQLREKIADDLDKAISTIGSADKIAELEQIINRYNDDVISKLRRQVPSADERGITILTLSAAGFSLRSISLITGINVGNLNNLWYRLKKRVTDSSAPDRDLILTLFRR